MYKNIIFDIGNVLLNFSPKEYLSSKFDNPKLVDELYFTIFKSNEWVRLDEGTITPDEAEAIFCMGDIEYSSQIKYVMEDWCSMLTPIESSIQILREIKQKGYKLYILSNYHAAAFKISYERNDFFKLFDGMVISSEVKMLKPDSEIYEFLLNKYRLSPSETIFIDDTEKNIDAAGKLGIGTIRFINADALRKNLIISGML